MNPEPTEAQRRVLKAMGDIVMEADPSNPTGVGIPDEQLAERLDMSVAEVRDHVQALVDLGFLGTRPQEVPRPEGPCRRCGKPADGLDQMCDPCRAIWACDRLCDSLTNALENFLDDEWGAARIRQATAGLLVDKPNFDGDPAPYMARIATSRIQRSRQPRRGLSSWPWARGCGRRRKAPANRSTGTPRSSTAHTPPSIGASPTRPATTPSNASGLR